MTFTITPTQYSALIAQAKAKGLAISGDGGTASKEGLTVSWSYDGTTLTLNVLKREWFDPSEATIEADIQAIITQVKQQNP
jgi:flagellar capping protein FliD